MSTVASPDSAAASRPRSGSIPVVVQQHAEDAASLRHVRSVLVRAPHVRLLQLGRLDERIAAHLDGLLVAGEMGTALCRQALATPGVGEMFAATALAIESGDAAELEKLLAVAEAEPAGAAGLTSAFGWVSPSLLRGLSRELLASASAFRRGVGLASCVMHGVAADGAVAAAMRDANPRLRAQGMAAAGRLGRTAMREGCVDALNDEDIACRFEAARAAMRLGERQRSVAVLRDLAAPGGAHRADALMCLLQGLELRHARVVLKALSNDEADVRLLIRGIGVAGDPHFVPWLIAQMDSPQRSRLAGEAFSLITGLDLALLDLELREALGPGAGPTEDADDDNVALDEDESLPWPDARKLQSWWQNNHHRFTAGTRSFMGEPMSAAHCSAVLKSGFQRQRALAARYLCLLQPGTPLFNIAAPTRRQQRLLSTTA